MSTLNEIAEHYVRLTLAVGEHDPGYIDAYTGPAAWQQDVRKASLNDLLATATELQQAIATMSVPPAEETERRVYLEKHIASVATYIRQLQGHLLPFDEESAALYDAVSPALTPDDLDATLAQLDKQVPGQGDLNQRLSAYNRQFEIPSARLDAVFQAAVAESRARTLAQIPLPENESFRIAYVKDQVWSAYNWYKGNAYSLIEVNTDFPMFIARAIDLASHEAYPGHHVFNLLIEQDLVQQKQWMEYAVYPLYSPASFLAEGSANYGIEVAFPRAERLQFEKEVLFPLAGIHPELADDYYAIQDTLQALSYAGNMVAKDYLDGRIAKTEAVAMLMKYSLSDQQRSEQRLRFIEKNRSYVINYNLGQDVVKAWVEQQAGDNPQRRWDVFADLLRRPKTASMMR